jgi:hypothetical protein
LRHITNADTSRDGNFASGDGRHYSNTTTTDGDASAANIDAHSDRRSDSDGTSDDTRHYRPSDKASGNSQTCRDPDSNQGRHTSNRNGFTAQVRRASNEQADLDG